MHQQQGQAQLEPGSLSDVRIGQYDCGVFIKNGAHLLPVGVVGHGRLDGLAHEVVFEARH